MNVDQTITHSWLKKLCKYARYARYARYSKYARYAKYPARCLHPMTEILTFVTDSSQLSTVWSLAIFIIRVQSSVFSPQSSVFIKMKRTRKQHAKQVCWKQMVIFDYFDDYCKIIGTMMHCLIMRCQIQRYPILSLFAAFLPYWIVTFRLDIESKWMKIRLFQFEHFFAATKT
jgi:hypothetical protein